MVYPFKDLPAYLMANIFLLEHLGSDLGKWAFDTELAHIR